MFVCCFRAHQQLSSFRTNPWYSIFSLTTVGNENMIVASFCVKCMYIFVYCMSVGATVKRKMFASVLYSLFSPIGWWANSRCGENVQYCYIMHVYVKLTQGELNTEQICFERQEWKFHNIAVYSNFCVRLLVIVWNWCPLFGAILLKYQAKGTQNDITPSHIILTSGQRIIIIL